jgi:Na+/H+ antiporter NhaB
MVFVAASVATAAGSAASAALTSSDITTVIVARDGRMIFMVDW